MILGKYQAIGEIQRRGYSNTATVQSENGECYFAKWILGIAQNSQQANILQDKLTQLKKVVHHALPPINDHGWDENQGAYCIVFQLIKAESLNENIGDIEPLAFLKGIEQISECLLQLHQDRRVTHGDLTPANILIDNDCEFYLIDLGISDISATLSQEEGLEIFAKAFAAPEKWNKEVDKGFPYQSDIYSIGKVVEWYFEQRDFSEPEKIKAFIDACCQKSPSNRPNYTPLLESLAAIIQSAEIKSEYTVMVEGGNSTLIEDLNCTEFLPKYDVAPGNGGNILLNMITQRFWVHGLWVIDEKKLTILKLQNKADSPKYVDTFKYASSLGLSVKYESGSNTLRKFDLTPILSKRKSIKQQKNEYRKERTERDKQLDFYKDLIKKELEVLHNNSLRLKYSTYKKKSDFEIWFKIKEDEKLSSRAAIYSHIDQSTPPNAEEFEYNLQSGLRFSGIAYSYDSKSGFLKFKDCERLDSSNIPKNGLLSENISRQEEEKKRQKDAIRKVEYNEVQNKELIHYLFNPDELKGQSLNQYELEQVFQSDAENRKLNYSPNQSRAILNAVHREPLTVIQGPPGTGKTTVITEIVFQILNRNPNAKILITSQTNDAVDNVLDNLLAKEIPIVRLSGVRKPKASLKKHTLEQKIEGWKDEVKKKALKEWKEIETQFANELKSENVLLKSLFDILCQNKDWKLKRKPIENFISRIRAFENLNKSLESESAFIEALQQISKQDFQSFFTKKQLHTDWLAALSSLNEKSSLNQKLIDSIRVIGATTNHIASKKYAKYNFEFDYVIMDESGKATVAEALIPIVMAEKLVLVGDHRQLRPVLTANRKVEQWLRNKYKEEALGLESWDDYFNRPSLFEEVITCIDDDFKSQLQECRRMPQSAVKLTSKYFYESYGDEPIKPVKRPIEKEHNLSLKIDSSIIFLDIANTYKSETDNNRSSKNKVSAALIPKLLSALDQYQEVKDQSIGIITGYTAQVREIKTALRKQPHSQKPKNIKLNEVPISVIDRFQGLEKDIIILDLVRSQQNTLGFLSNANRINVALSRHKKLLIIVGNYDWMIQAKSHPQGGNHEDAPNSLAPLQQYLKALDSAWIVNNLNQIF